MKTVKLMIGIFDRSGSQVLRYDSASLTVSFLRDRDRSGTIDLGEFEGLWKNLTDWRRCFDSYDRDRCVAVAKQIWPPFPCPFAIDRVGRVNLDVVLLDVSLSLLCCVYCLWQVSLLYSFRSGSIDFGELTTALKTFGYSFSPSVTSLVFSKYDK